jgi:dipeptidyl aminopeptidase/acylaminoacyl peptidase
MPRTPLLQVRRLSAALALSTLAFGALAAQGSGYRMPPDAINKILDGQGAPVVSISPDRRFMLITSSDVDEVTIEELAEPTMFLAGRRFRTAPRHEIELVGVRTARLQPVEGGSEITIDIPAGTRLSAPQWSRDGKRIAFFHITEGRMGVRVYDVATKRMRAVTAPALVGRLASAGGWSRDGKNFLFSSTTPSGSALWVADMDVATAKRLTPANINYIAGGCSWTAGKAPAICLMFPAGRGAMPKEPSAPAGPIIQESYGRAAPTRTNTYLLKNQYDEALFDYYFTSQVASIGLDGTMRNLGAPSVYAQPAASPDGNHLIVRATHRPYSYQVGAEAFPTKIEVWNPQGRVMKTIVDRPLLDNQSSLRDATSPGIRSVTWRPDEPATLVLVEALDDGDPRKQVPKRDRVSLLPAPFTAAPAPLVETEYRYGGIQWLSKNVAWLSDQSQQRTRVRVWAIDPSQPNGGTPRQLWDYNYEDRTATPGNLLFAYDPASDRNVPITSSDGKYLYLTGTGASKDSRDGDRPYLDRLEIATGKTERLWQSTAPNYELVTTMLDPDAKRIVLRRESPTERPDYYLRDMTAKALTRLTSLPDPEPFFTTVKGELITYKRDDGISLSGTLYLPPGYDKARDGKLPFFLWAYPAEFMSADAASQVVGSPYQFRRPNRQDHLLLLAAGYGVLDNPTMPIVSQNGKEPNDTYNEQLVASAKAAIEKLVDMGVGDRDKMSVGGHSYGAFMTANLLAHSDLFKAGIARSGAYNRTLTPFGFQAEPRSYWEAPEIYNRMSPFNYADKIKEPILLIHGTHDNNQGTFPIQSERMFAAIKGNGGNVRYVQLPLESHGYSAKESRRHVVWEMVNWLDTHVKKTKITP